MFVGKVRKRHQEKQIPFRVRLCKHISIFLLVSPFFLFAEGGEGSRTVRPYELYDPRFCSLTPRPFLCEECLKQQKRFAQFLSFDRDGRPLREYGCLDWKRPYLD